MNISHWLVSKAELCAFVTGTTFALATPLVDISVKILVAFFVGAASTLGAHLVKTYFAKNQK